MGDGLHNDLACIYADCSTRPVTSEPTLIYDVYLQACPKDKDANEIRQKAYERGGHRPRPNTVR